MSHEGCGANTLNSNTPNLIKHLQAHHQKEHGNFTLIREQKLARQLMPQHEQELMTEDD